MTTQDYIDSQEAYLERLRQMRQREKKHLSDVDFALFSKSFDRLVSKVENDLNESRLSLAKAMLAVGNQTQPCICSVSGNAVHLGSSVLDGYFKICTYHVVMVPCEEALVSGFREHERYPRQISMNSVFVRNDENSFDFRSPFASAIPA